MSVSIAHTLLMRTSDGLESGLSGHDCSGELEVLKD